MVSYAAALRSILPDYLHLNFSLNITIGSVVLNSYISIGAILAFLSLQYPPISLCLTVDYQRDNIGGCCQFLAGIGGLHVSSWYFSGWLSRMKVLKIPMLQRRHNSRELVQTWRFHDTSFSSFLHYHTNSWDSCFEHYRLAIHAQNRLPWVWTTGCCV